MIRVTRPARYVTGFVVALLIVIVAVVRFMSPSDWRRIIVSPRRASAAVIAYKELVRMSTRVSERLPWRYEVTLDDAPSGQIHVIYAPRLYVDEAKRDLRRPGAEFRVADGVEVHVLVDERTLTVKRTYRGE